MNNETFVITIIIFTKQSKMENHLTLRNKSKLVSKIYVKSVNESCYIHYILPEDSDNR